MSAEVRRMFASIAPRYDAANELLSLGIHKGWRRRAVELAQAGPGKSVLDCATGTGDLALEFKRTVGLEGDVVGTDFCAGAAIERDGPLGAPSAATIHAHATSAVDVTETVRVFPPGVRGSSKSES